MQTITESQLYWITRLDGIGQTVGVLTVILGIVTPICALLYFISNSMAEESYSSKSDAARAVAFKKMTKILLPVFLVLLCGGVFIPTTREYCAIKVIPVLANDQEVQALGKDIVQLAKDWIVELKPKSVDKAEK